MVTTDHDDNIFSTGCIWSSTFKEIFVGSKILNILGRETIDSFKNLDNLDQF